MQRDREISYMKYDVEAVKEMLRGKPPGPPPPFEDFVKAMRPYRGTIENLKIWEIVILMVVDSDEELKRMTFYVRCEQVQELVHNTDVLNRIHRQLFFMEWPLFSTPQNINDIDWRKLRQSRKNFKYWMKTERTSLLVDRTFVAIEECHAPMMAWNSSKGDQFSFRCPLQTNELQKIDEKTHYCDVCNSHVYYAQNQEEFDTLAHAGECVSVKVVDTSYRAIDNNLFGIIRGFPMSQSMLSDDDSDSEWSY